MTQQLEKRNVEVEVEEVKIATTFSEMMEQLQNNPKDRDYGIPLSDVCDAIHSGVLVMSPGHPVPVIKYINSGRTHNGTGKAYDSGHSGKDSLVERLKTRGNEDAELVYEWILDSAANGNSKAQIWLLEKFSGKPVEERVRKDPTAMAALVASLREPTLIHVEEYIEAEIIDE